MLSPMYFWLAAFVVFGAVEAATAGLTSIWFAIGALVTLVATAIGATVWLQVTIFILTSALALLVTRPLAMRFFNDRRVATNTDRVLGQTAKVTEDIDNIAGRGAVYVDGKTWTARNRGEGVIPAGTLVTIRSVEGVKLIVEQQIVRNVNKEEI